MRTTAAPRRWSEAWEDAATGPDGFWRRHQVADEFRTPSTSAAMATRLAHTIAGLLDARPAIERVIELGAGSAGLIREISRLRPQLCCLGTDLRSNPIRSNPIRSNAPIGWLTDVWSTSASGWLSGELEAVLVEPVPTMIIAVEWLDEIPVVPLERDPRDRLREHWVSADGRECDGGPAAPEDLRWAERWWPSGARIEVGRHRDRAWSWLIAKLGSAGGSALMIDYGHLRSGRPEDPRIRGYAAGRRRPATPDGGVNLTGDVAVDAVAAAGIASGARTAVLARQADVLPEAPHDIPADPLTRLVARSAHAALASTAPERGFGRYWWLLQDVDRR